jgi:hypothetical protein
MAVSELWSLYSALTTRREENFVIVAVVVVFVVVVVVVVTAVRIQVTVFRFCDAVCLSVHLYVVPKRLYPQTDVRCITGRTTNCMDCELIGV